MNEAIDVENAACSVLVLVKLEREMSGIVSKTVLVLTRLLGQIERKFRHGQTTRLAIGFERHFAVSWTQGL